MRNASLVVLLAAACAAPADAQYSTPYSYGSSSRSRTGSPSLGGFPSWEREVSASDQDPLPLAQQGEFEVAHSVALGQLATGVAASPRGGFVTALAGGVVEWRSCGGELRARHDVGSALSAPPLPIGSDVLVTGPDVVARVGEDGVRWRRAMTTPAVLPAALSGESLLLVTAKGLELRSAADGEASWTAEVAGVRAGPAWLPGAVLVGTSDGDVVALDRVSGAEAWRQRLGERIDALVSIEGPGGGVFFTGYGRSRRSQHDRGPFIARLASIDSGLAYRGVPWLLRTGAACEAPPVLLDGLVAFACHDGFVHAVDPRKGTPGWRADVPARVSHAPAEAGGRLDFALSPTRWLVALAAENGAVMGWTALGDEDETFVGPATRCEGVTLVATSFDRVIALRWKPGEQPTEQEREDPRRVAEESVRPTAFR